MYCAQYRLKIVTLTLNIAGIVRSTFSRQIYARISHIFSRSNFIGLPLHISNSLEILFHQTIRSAVVYLPNICRSDTIWGTYSYSFCLTREDFYSLLGYNWQKWFYGYLQSWHCFRYLYWFEGVLISHFKDKTIITLYIRKILDTFGLTIYKIINDFVRLALVSLILI